MRRPACVRFLVPVALALAGGCATTEPGPAPARAAAAPAPRAVMAETRLPAAFPAALAPEPSPRITVPPGLLLTATVARPHAEVRSGPGIQYELADRLLDQGQRLVLFSHVGVWRKVVDPTTGEHGWVHSAALSAPKPSTTSLTVDVKLLPTVFALHPVETAAAYPSAAPLKVDVPKGAQFRTLRRAAVGTLVYLPQTDSVMWMSRKDVQ